MDKEEFLSQPGPHRGSLLLYSYARNMSLMYILIVSPRGENEVKLCTYIDNGSSTYAVTWQKRNILSMYVRVYVLWDRNRGVSEW